MNRDYEGVLQPRGALTAPIPGRVAKIHGHQIIPGHMGTTGTTYRFEFNTDPAILARVWDGTTHTVFSVNVTGAVTATGVTISPGSTDGIPLIIKDSLDGTSGYWTAWQDSGGTTIAAVDNGGGFNTQGTFQQWNALDDANAVAVFGSSGIFFGVGGGTAVDVNLYRSAANVLKTDDSFIVGGDLTVVGSVSGTTSQTRITLSGTQRLKLDGPGDRGAGTMYVGSPTVVGTPVVGTPRTPHASFVVPDGYYLRGRDRITLGPNIRCTLEGSGEVEIENFNSTSRLNLIGKG